MKKTLFLFSLLCFLFNMSVLGQNLVPNPSFEDTVSCPTTDNQLSLSVGWEAFGSVEYFNRCSSSPDVGVPNNWGGFQEPATGDSYVGIFTAGDDTFGYSCNNSSYCDSREYIGQYLSSPLTIGTKYFISFKTSLSISSTIFCNCATDKIGLMFSVGKPSFTMPTTTLIKNSAHIFTPSVVTDSTGWTTIQGTFVADSAYQYFVIGNLFDDPNTNIQIMDGNTYCNSYYFIDDVCVSTDSLTCVNSVGIDDTPFNQNTFNVYPNPATNQITVENLQLGDAYQILIYNSLGQLLHSEKEVQAANNKIDINTFSNGLLLINIKSENQNFFYKLLKN
ncbi:MAG: T9SS type A sorting domain-containing protein [Bacteroidetes bacterium]|nr:MAG: T9SS type A sorting domain-containing protein [Bacteroidota bacterium]